MSNPDYQKLMDMTFKGSFISNTLTKLLKKEISPEISINYCLKKKQKFQPKILLYPKNKNIKF